MCASSTNCIPPPCSLFFYFVKCRLYIFFIFLKKGFDLPRLDGTIKTQMSANGRDTHLQIRQSVLLQLTFPMGIPSCNVEEEEKEGSY